MRIMFILLLVPLGIFCLASCVSPSSMGTEGGACFEGGKCLDGLTCSAEGMCEKTPAGADGGGVDAGSTGDTGVHTDAGFDAGADAAFDSGTDAATDGGEDAANDGGTDGSVDGGSDAGADAGTDAGTDAGVEIVLQSGGLVGSAGVCENADYVLNFAVEWNAATVMENADLRLVGGAVILK